MANIEHATITDPNIHEPKGIASASAGQLYKADGAGSGAWEDTILNVHGEMYIVNNSTAIVVPAAVDPTLNTDTDYVKVNGTLWNAGHNEGVSFSVNELILPTAGDYEVFFWASLTAPTNATVAFKYVINDTTFSTRKVKSSTKAATETENISAGGFLTGISASDTVGIYVASDTAGDIIIEESGLVVKLMHE